MPDMLILRKENDGMEPIIGSRESKVRSLMIRKEELLLIKSLTKGPQDIDRVDNLLKDVDDLIRKYEQPTTIQRRVRRENEQKTA
jgi:hypothetical protein